jgi:hypothetical protein
MTKCPHCQKKTFSTWKAHNSAFWRVFTCSNCKKKSKAPLWPKFYFAAILIAYLIVQSYVGYAEAYIVGIPSVLLLIIYYSFKFELVVVDESDKRIEKESLGLNFFIIFFLVLSSGHILKVWHDVKVRNLTDYIARDYEDYMEPRFVKAIDYVMSFRFPDDEMDPE